MTYVPAITRRRFLLAAAGSFAGSIGLRRLAHAADPTRARFSLVVASDLHYRDERCDGWFDAVVQKIRSLQPQPAFVVLAGDLSEDGRGEQIEAVGKAFARLPMPVRSIIGNHDHASDGSRAAWESIHGTDQNRCFVLNDWQFLLLDSTWGQAVYRTWIPAGTLHYLDHTLPRLSRNKPVVAITHFPLGRNWLRPLNHRAVTDRLEPYNFRAAFSGHWHGLTERTHHGTAMTTSRCCSWWRTNHDGSDERGFLLCEVHGGEITHRFVAVT